MKSPKILAENSCRVKRPWNELVPEFLKLCENYLMLITLAKIDALHVVGQLPIRFISPREVYEELKADESLGYTKAEPGWLEIKINRRPRRTHGVDLP